MEAEPTSTDKRAPVEISFEGKELVVRVHDEEVARVESPRELWPSDYPESE